MENSAVLLFEEEIGRHAGGKGVEDPQSTIEVEQTNVSTPEDLDLVIDVIHFVPESYQPADDRRAKTKRWRAETESWFSWLRYQSRFNI